MLDIFYGYLLMTCVSLFSQVFFILWPSLLIFFIVSTLWCILFQLHFFFKVQIYQNFFKVKLLHDSILYLYHIHFCQNGHNVSHFDYKFCSKVLLNWQIVHLQFCIVN